MKLSKFEKGFAPIIILISLVLLAILGGIIYKTQVLKSNISSPTQIQSQINTPPNSPSTTFDISSFQPKLTYPNAYNGPLYATKESVGNESPFDQYFADADRNGVGISIFYIWTGSTEFGLPSQLLDIFKKHHGRIVPFFSPGFSASEATPLVGDKLTGIYKQGYDATVQEVGPDFLKGVGEVEMYAWQMQPDDPKILQIFDFADSHHLPVMFHYLPGQNTAIDHILTKYPNNIFLIHLYHPDFAKESNNIIDLMNKHTNLYFTIDADHLMYDSGAGTGLLYKYDGKDLATAKAGFISDFDSNYQEMLQEDLTIYKPMINAHPDRVMWGTEMNLKYTFEPEVYDRIVKLTRLFIGQLNPEVQKKFAYENALRVFGTGVTLTNQNIPSGSNDITNQAMFDQVEKQLGCDSVNSCMALCSKPENADKCKAISNQSN